MSSIKWLGVLLSPHPTPPMDGILVRHWFPSMKWDASPSQITPRQDVFLHVPLITSRKDASLHVPRWRETMWGKVSSYKKKRDKGQCRDQHKKPPMLWSSTRKRTSPVLLSVCFQFQLLYLAAFAGLSLLFPLPCAYQTSFSHLPPIFLSHAFWNVKRHHKISAIT